MEKSKEETMQTAISQAEKSVKESGIADEELRKIAFTKAIDYFLGNTNQLPKSSTNVTEVPSSGQNPSTDDQNFWDNLASATGRQIAQLKDLYTLKGGNQILVVVPKIKGKTIADQRRNLAGLVLLAYHEGQKMEWVPAKFVAEAAKHSQLYSDSNFAQDLKMDWFRTMGKKKGLEYKLSSIGISDVNKYLTE